ncbi:MAG: hypothetical protein AB1797_06115 [bacterium]
MAEHLPNFYEGWLTKGEIEEAVPDIKAFCDKIKEIIKKKVIK